MPVLPEKGIVLKKRAALPSIHIRGRECGMAFCGMTASDRRPLRWQKPAGAGGAVRG